MSNELEKTVNDHDYRIEALENGVTKVLGGLEKLTDALNNQATQFAVYASKHDTVSAEQSFMKNEIKIHGESIAAMKPVVDGIRGLVWKVVTAAVMGGTGVAAIIVSLLKYNT